MAKDKSKIYEPLDKKTNEIRLLRIHPNLDPDAIVEVEVFKRDLKTAIEDTFIPFSYVWGDGSQTVDIVVNSQTKAGGRNLAAMLKQARNVILREPLKNDPRKHGYLFWADALCIDQSNLEERNHQVSLMKEIYGSARLAVAWLGEVPECEKAIQLITAIAVDWYGHRSHTDFLRYDGYVDPDLGEWVSKYPEFWKRDISGAALRFPNSYWRAFWNIPLMPFWQRAWIYQETMLPRSVLIMLGSTVISLRSIIAASMLVKSIEEHVEVPSVVVDEHVWKSFASAGSHSVSDLVRTTMTEGRFAARNLKLVVLTLHFKATDPRDKIYGLLGIMKTAINPDYSKTVEELYRDVALAWWYELGDTNFLLWAGMRGLKESRKDRKLPSWTPDWDALLGCLLPTVNDCSTGTRLEYPPVQFAPAINSILISGIVFDEIRLILSPIFRINDGNVFGRLFGWISGHIAQRGKTEPATGTSFFHALFRMTVMRRWEWFRTSRQRARAAAVMLEIGKCLCWALLAGALDSDGFYGTEKSFDDRINAILHRLHLSSVKDFIQSCIGEDVAKHVQVPQFQWEDWEEMKKDYRPCLGLVTGIEYALAGRALFLTEKGYLGLSTTSDVIAVRDRVAIIAKCEMPILLRGHRTFKVVEPA